MLVFLEALVVLGDFGFTTVTKNCLSQVLEHSIEQSRTGGHPAVTYLCKNIPERSIFYVITKNRSCLNVLNRSF